jgi:hypothetical protein
VKVYKGRWGLFRLFLASTLNGSEWLTSFTGSFLPKKEIGTHWTGGWVGAGAGLPLRTPPQGFHIEVHQFFERLKTSVTSVKNNLWLPDDGPYEVRNILECILEF